MFIYFFLFTTGFLNEAVLTKYYILAAKGERWKCVALSLTQQLISCGSMYYTIVNVAPMSKEQFIRWFITAISYGCATAWIVKPDKNQQVNIST